MLTLVEAAKLSTQPLEAGIIEIFALNNPVLERMPFVNIGGAALRFNRESELPTTTFRAINAAYAESTGKVDPVTEPLFIAGGDSDYDRALVEWGNGSPDLRAAHDTAKAKSLSVNWMKTFIDGDNAANPSEFNGLNTRLSGGTQEINLGGATLDLDSLDLLIDQVQGRPGVLFMSKAMRRQVNKLIRAANQAQEVVTDAFGRQLQAYAGIPIAEIEEDATNAEILDFDEDYGGGSSNGASIYAVRFDVGTGLHGIQSSPISVRDLGELDTKPAFRTRVEWYASFTLKHPEAVARLKGITA